jgi:hypothetical protein
MRHAEENILHASSGEYVRTENVVQVAVFQVHVSVKSWLDQTMSRGIPQCLQLNSGMESQILRQPLSYSSVPYPTIQC